MNKEYYVDESKVHVRNSNGKFRDINYTANIDEVLVTENVIEEINKELVKLNDEKEYLLKIIKNKNSKLYLIPMILLLIGMILPLLISLIEGNIYLYPLILRISSLIVIPPMVFIYVKDKLSLYFTKETLYANNQETQTLKNELNKNEIKLDKLKRASILKTAKYEKVYQVNDKEKLMELKRKLEISRELAYNIKRYIKYYQKGKLRAYLKDKYSNKEIDTIENIIEDNDLILRRKI